MPHYADGTKAEVGDAVRGQHYLFPHEAQGVVVQILQSETCNMTVAFPQVVDCGDGVKIAQLVTGIATCKEWNKVPTKAA